MPAAFKHAIQERINDVERRAGSYDSCAQTKDVASLCCRAMRALRGSLQTTARTSKCLFTAMDIPTPIPHMRIACSISLAWMERATARAKSGVVAVLACVGPELAYGDSAALHFFDQGAP